MQCLNLYVKDIAYFIPNFTIYLIRVFTIIFISTFISIIYLLNSSNYIKYKTTLIETKTYVTNKRNRTENKSTYSYTTILLKDDLKFKILYYFNQYINSIIKFYLIISNL